LFDRARPKERRVAVLWCETRWSQVPENAGSASDDDFAILQNQGLASGHDAASGFASLRLGFVSLRFRFA
jgi:hypothetical protein